MIKNVASTRGNLVDLGLKLGRHENGEHLLSADFICDVAIRDGRIDFIGVRLLAKNSLSRQKISPVDNFDGRLNARDKQHRRANRYAINQRGHGGSLELHRAAVDSNFGALHAERTIDAAEMLRNFLGDSRIVCVNGLARRRRFDCGVHNNFWRNSYGGCEHHRQIEIEQRQHGSADDVANGFRRNRTGRLFVNLPARRNSLVFNGGAVRDLQRRTCLGIGVFPVELRFDAP